MRVIMLHFFGSTFLLLLMSCTQQKVTRANFIYSDTLKFFDLTKEPYSAIVNEPGRFSDFKIDTAGKIYQSLKPYGNSYETFFYSKIPGINAFTVFSYYDYEQDIILVTEDKNGKFQLHPISTISGDGGEFYFKQSEYRDGVFISEFIEGERTFTSPIDTVIYHLTGTSKIAVLPDGSIKEDTLSLRKHVIKFVDEAYDVITDIDSAGNR